MGFKDPKVKTIADEKHVCDLINGSFFQGKQLLTSEKMKKLPESAAVVFQDGNGKEKKAERMMDGLFEYDENEIFMIFSLENQDDISYIMPVREMLSAALQYNTQILKRRKELREQRVKQESGEVLSGFLKADRLKPVCCIVFYYGDKPWDGATSLHELLEFPPELEGLQEFCPDFKINLIECSQVNPEHFQTGLRQLFELLPYAGDKKGLYEYVQTNRERFENLNDECCDLLKTFFGVRFLDHVRRKKYRNKAGGYSMCKAIEDLIKDSKKEGKREGRREGTMESLLLILRAKGTVNEELLIKIRSTKDADLLQKWLLIAVNAESAEAFEATI